RQAPVTDQPQYLGCARRSATCAVHCCRFCTLTTLEPRESGLVPTPPRPQTWFARGRRPPTPAAPFSNGCDDAQASGKSPQSRCDLPMRLGVLKEPRVQQRLDAMKISPAAFKAVAGMQAYVD